MPPLSSPRRQRPLATVSRRGRGGFTLVEALIASALLGFSLIVMFGFHSQAVRSNMHARKMTDCTYLAQLKMEQLQSVPWTEASMPSTLDTSGTDTTSTSNLWATLPHLNGEESGDPGPVDAQNQRVSTTTPGYWVSWDVESMDAEETWARIRVRCVYQDRAFNQWRGTTISSFRFRDS